MEDKKEVIDDNKELIDNSQFKINSTSLMLIVFALCLIGGGIALSLSGNNKSLINKGQSNKENYSNIVKDEPKTEDPQIVIRNHVSEELTVAKAIELIENEKKLHGDTWTISVANIKGVNKDNSYLVDIDVVLEDGSVDALQTIISELEDGMKVEYPLWHEGEVDLTLYAFNPIETKEENETVEGQTVQIDNIEETDPTVGSEEEVVVEPIDEPILEQEIVENNEEVTE